MMEALVEIKRMELRHISQIAAIEKKAFADPWSEASFQGELDNPLACYYVAEQNGQVLGYGGLWEIAGEGNITNIAVKEGVRGKGIGSEILCALIRYAKAHGFRFLTLEVRVSNEAAKCLYEKYGFRPVGLRRGYYADNREDALLMTLEWDETKKGRTE